MLLGYNGHGAQRRHAGRARRAEPADRGGVQRVPDHEGTKFSSSPRRGHLRRATSWRGTTPDALRYFIAGGRPGEPGHRLHLGRVRPPQQRRAGRRAGATWSTGRSRWRPRTSARSRRPGALTDADRALLAASPARVRHRRRRCSRGRGRRRRSARRCGVVGRGEQVPVRPGAVEAANGRPGPDGARCCTSRCRWSTTPRRCSRRSCRARRRGARGCSAATGDVGGDAASCVEVDEPTAVGSPSYPVLTGDYDTAARGGSRRRSRSAGRSRRRRRCSPSSTRRSWTRSWPGSTPVTRRPVAAATATAADRCPSRCRPVVDSHSHLDADAALDVGRVAGATRPRPRRRPGSSRSATTLASSRWCVATPRRTHPRSCTPRSAVHPTEVGRARPTPALRGRV